MERIKFEQISFEIGASFWSLSIIFTDTFENKRKASNEMGYIFKPNLNDKHTFRIKDEKNHVSTIYCDRPREDYYRLKRCVCDYVSIFLYCFLLFYALLDSSSFFLIFALAVLEFCCLAMNCFLFITQKHKLK